MANGILESAFDSLTSLFKRGPESSDRVTKLWHADKEARRPREKQWQINVSYYLGQQWIGWNPHLFLVEDLKAPAYRRQAVDNRLFVKVRSMVTRMVTLPGWQVIPETTDLKDIRNAKVKERVLAHVTRAARLKEKLFGAATWGKVCGDAYFEVYWDEDAGELYADESGLISAGEVGIRVRSPYEVYPGRDSTDNGWGGRCWVVDLMPVDIVRAKYNTDEISADAANFSDTRLRAKLNTFFNSESPFAGGGGADTKPGDELTAVQTLYEFRSALLPEGRVTTVINGKVYDEKPLAYFPLCHYRNMPHFSSFYGDTELRQAIPRQKSLNRLVSSVEEYLRVMKGKWLISSATKIRAHQVDSEHGEKLIYDGNGPAPQMVTPPPLPSDLWQMVQMNSASIDDIFSDHPVSQGKAPASMSGAAINYLIEEDQRQHTPTLQQWETSLEQVGEKILTVAGANYQPGRKIIVVGDDRRADIEDIDPAMLAGVNRVMVRIGDSLPSNKTLRAEIIRRNFAEGAYGDQMDPEVRRKYLRQLDAGVVDDIYDDTAQNEQRAERENDAMKSGGMAIPDAVEDHVTHMRVHRHFMTSRDYELLPEEIKDIFEAHYFLTEQMAQAGFGQALMLNEAAKAQGAASPGNPSPGAPPAAASGPQGMQKEVGQAAEPAPPPGAPMPQ